MKCCASQEESLRTEIIGQDLAVSAVSRAMCRASSLIRDPNRPIASFLFCGPTGVGKTELTKVLWKKKKHSLHPFHVFNAI